MSDPRINSMRDEASSLARLCDDPHPRLFTWASFVHHRIEAINKLWYGRARPESDEDELRYNITPQLLRVLNSAGIYPPEGKEYDLVIEERQ